MLLRVLGLALAAGLWDPAHAVGGEPPTAPLLRFPDLRGGEIPVTQGIERPVRIRYSQDIAPATFRATLNGKDVTRLFNPAVRGGIEAVRLPLTAGENNLRIEVNSRSAVGDPHSMLLPQEHLVTLRMQAMETRPLADVQVYASQQERDAALKKIQEKLGVR